MFLDYVLGFVSLKLQPFSTKAMHLSVAGSHLGGSGLREEPSRNDYAFHFKNGELDVSFGILRMTRGSKNGLQSLENLFLMGDNLQDGPQ